MKVHQLMTKDVASIASEAPLKEAARIMIDRKVSGLPVMDDGLVGMITEGDILHQESLKSPSTTLRSLFRSTGEISLTVADAMTRKVVSVSGDADHTEAARLMESSGVKRLPVLNDDGVLLGIISRSDVLKVFGRPDQDIQTEITNDVVERILWLDPASVQIEVDEGRVSLSGSVPARSDARILEEMAKRVDGVIKVEAARLSYNVDDTKRSDGPLTPNAPRPNW